MFIGKIPCILFSVLCCALFLNGCTKDDNGATIAGTVLLIGTCPHDASCAASVDAGCHCDSITAGHWMTHNGNVANALIYIKDGLGNTAYPVPEEPVTLDQRGCKYEPHVMGMMVGQTLRILNSDPTLHNVHLTSMNASEGFNKLFTQGMPPMEEKFSTPGIRAIKCDVHSWMNCYAGVFTHPFFAVSDSNGYYEIHGLPAGHYVLELWHESSAGAENAIVETKDITIAGKDKQTVNFSIAAH